MNYKDYYVQKHCNPCKPCNQCTPYTEYESTRYCCPRLNPKKNCVEPVVDICAGPGDPIRFHLYKEMNVNDVFSGHVEPLPSSEYRKMPVNDVFSVIDCV